MSKLLDPARPKYARRRIAALDGYTNGLLDNRVLAPSSVRGLKCNVVSVRKFNALQKAAVRDGIALSSTGDYRTRQSQDILLLARYDKGYFPGRLDYNYYQGSQWSLKPGMAPAATPGLSPHGWGRARHFAEMINGDTIPDSLSTRAKVWLANNAPRFGIFFDTPVEDWHGEDYAGDTIDQAVLDEEAGIAGPDIPPFVPAQGLFSLYPLDPTKAMLELRDPPMCSDLVSYLQGVLMVRLSYPILVDGWFGQTTHDCVRWYQGTRGLPITGLVDSATWAAIDRDALGVTPTIFAPENGQFGDYPSRQKPRTVRGDKGDYVRYLQGALRFKFGHTDLKVDGDFGPTTEAHVRWFQGTKSTTIDGVVGSQTWALIDG